MDDANTLYSFLYSLTSLFILQPEDHRPMWYIYTITDDIIAIYRDILMFRITKKKSLCIDKKNSCFLLCFFGG